MNKFEKSIARHFEEQGYTVLHKGWPDLLVEKDGELLGVEVKNVGDKPRPSQIEMHICLAKIGLWVTTLQAHKTSSGKRIRAFRIPEKEAAFVEHIPKRKRSPSNFDELGLS